MKETSKNTIFSKDENHDEIQKGNNVAQICGTCETSTPHHRINSSSIHLFIYGKYFI